MICNGCGKELTDSQLFCPNCGQKNEEADRTQQNLTPQNLTPQDLTSRESQQTPPMEGKQNQIPSNVMQQGQVPQNRMSSYPIPQGPTPPNRIWPSVSYPPIPPYPPSGKKRNYIPVIIVAVIWGLMMLSLGIFTVLQILKDVNETQDQTEDVLENSEISGDSDTYADNGSDTYDDSDAGNYNNSPDYITDYYYSYLELPNVISLDSDYRFHYFDSYSDDNNYTYVYKFDPNFTESDLYDALNNYCILLQDENGFVIDDDYGESTVYLTADNVTVSVSAAASDTGNYAYIVIIPYSDSSSDDIQVY